MANDVVKKHKKGKDEEEEELVALLAIMMLLLLCPILAAFFFRKTGEPSDPGGTITIEVIGAVKGIETLEEGSVGNIVRVAVANTSKNNGEPWPVTFRIPVEVTVDSTVMMSQSVGVRFEEDEVRTIDFTFDIPLGIIGSGSASAVLKFAPTDGILSGPVTADFIVTGATLVPSGIIKWV